jgi:hypothetical protein
MRSALANFYFYDWRLTSKRVGLALSLAAAFCLFAIAESQKPVLIKGELWIEGKKATETKGSIHSISVSPSGRYVAAAKIDCYFEEHDDSLEEGEKPDLIPAFSVLIVDIAQKRILREIKAPEELLHPMEWQKNNVYRFGTGSELDVANVYEYNSGTNKVRKLVFDYEQGDYK